MSAPSRSTSPFRTFCTTPLSDLLRGSLSGRLDTRRSIERAELPPELAAIVRRVVGDLRLMRAEKADVARELCAHFADGLEAGATASELAESFGDPTMSATLITSARKRARPMHIKIAMRTAQGLGVLVALLLVLYLFELARFHMGDPTISRDFVAEHNAQIEQIPEEERAWPIYRQAILALYPLTEEERDAIEWRPTEAQLATMAAIIAEKQEALALFRKASQRRVMGVPWSNGFDDTELAPLLLGEDYEPAAQVEGPPMLFDVLLPHLASLRMGARLLCVDARLAALQGESERALANLTAVVGMSTHVHTGETLIEALVDLDIFSIASGTTLETLRLHSEIFSEEELLTLAHEFAGAEFDPIPALKTERAFFLDVIQRSFTDDGSGDGVLVDEGIELLNLLDMGAEPSSGPALTGPIARLLVGSRADQVALHDKIMTFYEARSALPLWKQFEEEDAADTLLENHVGDPSYLFVVRLVPALSRTIVNHELIRMERDRTLAAIALELYRKREGAYPQRLEQLVPQYLPALPIDRFDGQPFRYELRDGTPMVWSVGADLDDDRGVPARDQRGVLYAPRRPNDIDGDWVLYPPDWLLYPELSRDD